MKNKGQITIFVIIGVLIILFIGLLVAVRIYLAVEQSQETQEQVTELPSDLQEIEQFIRRCIRQSTLDGLTLLGHQGGYSSIPSLIQTEQTAYWHLDEVNIQPTLNQTKYMLEQYIDSKLETCLDFSILEQQKDVKIEYEPPKSTISFDAQQVAVSILLPLKIDRADFSTTYDFFIENFDIRWRRMYELATQINMKQLDAQFKFSQPLDLIEKADFDATYVVKDNSIIYTITDRTQLESGQHFSLAFASRLLNSKLKRLVQLQNNSRTVPSVFPYIIYSLDNKAQLYILPGTTSNRGGKDVHNITIQQIYPENVTRENVPLSEDEHDAVFTENLTWILTYPIYNFEPTGLRFNSPQRLVLYWDEDRTPHQGNMGILYNDGNGWRPIPSAANYQENYVYTDIPGFSSYSPVDCHYQPEKQVQVISKMDPKGSCVVTLIVLIVIVIVIIIVVTIFTFGIGTGPAAVATANAAAATAAAEATAAGAAATAAAEAAAIANAAAIAATGTAEAAAAAGAAATANAAAATAAATAAGAAATANAAAATAVAVAAAVETAAGVSLLDTVLATLSAGFTGTATAIGTAAVGVGTAWAVIGFAVVGGIVGGAYINSNLAYSSAGDDTLLFTPTCDQTITVHKETPGGSGMCIPEGTQEVEGAEFSTVNGQTRLVKAGTLQPIKAVTTKCNSGRTFFCGSCKTTCTTSFK